jgi:predicted amidophosphoribosyltransferase
MGGTDPRVQDIGRLDRFARLTMRLADVVRPAADVALGFAFPLLCLGCDARLRPDTHSLLLCPACLRRLPRAGADAPEQRLGRLPADAPRPDRTLALWTFDAGGSIRRVQHALKYGGRPQLGVDLGALVGRALAEAWTGSTYDAVVAIPLSRGRLLERGYNQAETLARGVAAATGSGHATDRLLVRSRAVPSQTRLGREARRANVAGAFAVAPGEEARLSGRRVLLVDDVLTTGATLSAATAPLLAAGAVVDAAVLACVAD